MKVGTLNKLEQFGFIAKLIQSQCHEQLSRWIWRFKLTGASRKTVDLEALRTPDTHLVKQTEQLVGDRYTPVMYAHCQRTWQFAWVVARAFDIHFDEEAFYIACLMHDLGLTEPCCHNVTDKGFHVLGAEESARFLNGRGVERDRVRLVTEAIERHLHLGTNLRNSEPESYLLKIGAHMDVIGSFAHYIESKNLASIHKSYPRSGFNQEIVKTINELPHQPNSHAGILRRLGFAKLVYDNPLNHFHH
ncbi:hypothetical protein HF888_12620 [Bermanella marisrubri]|uniref:Metal-dependent phosphohydrolase n=1 Tax=Bermanella marisrubri TaxID=207949 RepID=Q1N041_9GAMM|nr:hypothetical protein [Bermanella marisrubri]EAT11522.1 metal-dependent phosphohydrolase [Oceanobacter sp. RED65] [Bermanella marisrubri]QIZ85013.1 hypothetical protein HF888_12620 [Bermanella marisrubri]